MLHGLFGDLGNLGSVALHMNRYASVLRMDLPAHGRSPTLPELSFRAMADSVMDELDAQGIDQFDLLGHSLGGKVAMAMAGSERCQGLNRLCVVDIAPKHYPPHHKSILEALQAIDLQSIKDRRDADAQLRDAIADAGVRSFILKNLYRHESGGFRWRFDLQRLIEDYPLLQRSPVFDHRVEAPTLFIKGGRSDYLTADDEALIKPLFADPSLKIIEGAGHWPHTEKPAQFTRICQQFIAG